MKLTIIEQFLETTSKIHFSIKNLVLRTQKFKKRFESPGSSETGRRSPPTPLITARSKHKQANAHRNSVIPIKFLYFLA